MKLWTHALAIAAGLGVLGCGSDLTSADDDLGSGSEADSGEELGETGGSAGTGGEALPPACDPQAPSCAAGQKCVPWADEAGIFAEHRCVPVLGERGSGQLCQWHGPGVGTDDCDGASFCWHHDASGDGICRSLCTTSDDCDTNAGFACVGVAPIDNLCLPTCDPLVEPLVGGCFDGEACYLTSFEGAIVCLPPSAELRGPGEVCELANDCAPGLLCITGEPINGCAGERCCTRWCFPDFDDELCAGDDPAHSCVNLYDSGALPPFPSDHNIGACGVDGP